MKFISKSSNLLVVLRPGLSAQPLTGTPAKPTISVRFKDGIAEVTNDEIVAMMLEHPGFNADYISAESTTVDPYAHTRQPSEPAHVITELEFGTPVSRTVHGGKTALSPELQKMITAAATEMAKQMLPEMLKGILQAHAAEKKENVPAKVKGKPGRKPKAKAPEREVQSAPEPNPAIQEEVS